MWYLLIVLESILFQITLEKYGINMFMVDWWLLTIANLIIILLIGLYVTNLLDNYKDN